MGLPAGVVDVQADFGAAGDDSTDDTAAIQAAIDAVSLPSNYRKLGTVLFPTGYYRITSPLYVGYDFVGFPDPVPSEVAHFGSSSDATRPGNRTHRVHLKGLGSAVLRYYGALTDKYMLYYAPIQTIFHNVHCITNLGFECRNLTRGLFAFRCVYGSRFENIKMQSSRQIGFDFLNCIAAYFSGLQINACRGIGYRGIVWNSAVADNWKIDTDGTDNDYFPDTDDETIRGRNDSYVQTPVEERASVILKGALGNFRSMAFETPTNDVYPGIYIGEGDTLVNNILFEGGDYSGPKIRLADKMNGTVVENIGIFDRPNISESLVECLGSTYNCLFRGFTGYSAGVGVRFVGGDGTQVYGNRIENVSLYVRGSFDPVPAVAFDLTGTGEQKGNFVDGVLTSAIPLESSETPSLLGSLQNTPLGRGTTRLVGMSHELPASADVLSELQDGYEGQLISVHFLGNTSVRSTGNIAMDQVVFADDVIFFHNVKGTWRPIAEFAAVSSGFG